MFDSVEQLEKEVQDFRSNILASSELIKSIEVLVAAVKAQEDDFAAKSKALATKMDSHTDGMKEDYKEALSELIKENNKLLDEISIRGEAILRDMQSVPKEIDQRNDTLSKELKSHSEEVQSQCKSLIAQFQEIADAFSTRCTELLQSMDSSNNAHLNSVIEVTRSSQQEYIQKLETTEASIHNCENEIKNKYNDFLAKLESTNIDQMFKMCQEIKKAMNSKFLILTIGVGVSIVLVLATLFFR